MNKEKEIKEIVEYRGINTQMAVWIEEMSELIKPLCKIMRYGFEEKYVDEVKKELVDVSFCLDQMRYYFGISKEWEEQEYNFKVDREIGRIKNEQGK